MVVVNLVIIVLLNMEDGVLKYDRFYEEYVDYNFMLV